MSDQQEALIRLSTCRQMILDAVDLKDGAIAARDAEIARLREALEDAIESIEGWGAYASEYFKDKHDLAGDLARARAALEASHDEK